MLTEWVCQTSFGCRLCGVFKPGMAWDSKIECWRVWVVLSLRYVHTHFRNYIRVPYICIQFVFLIHPFVWPICTCMPDGQTAPDSNSTFFEPTDATPQYAYITREFSGPARIFDKTYYCYSGLVWIALVWTVFGFIKAHNLFSVWIYIMHIRASRGVLQTERLCYDLWVKQCLNYNIWRNMQSWWGRTHEGYERRLLLGSGLDIRCLIVS